MAGRLNAYTDENLSIDGAATGPLHGTSFAVKDLYDIKGTVAQSGNPDWGRTHEPATQSALAVRQLLEAGASVRGKTITDEFAFSIVGENHHFGTPVNVNAKDRVCGGSSSGSAAAVAGCHVDFALGTDTGGSVRVPASFCGLFGLRPTHGRVSLDGVFPLAPSFDTAGWFAREPTLMRRIGSILLNDDKAPTASPVRLLYPGDAWEQADPETRTALSTALKKLESRYGPAEPIRLSDDDGLDRWFETFRVAQGAEIWATLGGWIEETRPEIGPGIKERLAWCSGIGAEARAAADSERKRIADQVAEFTRDGAVLVMPVAPGPAIPAGQAAVASDAVRAKIIRLSGIAPLARVPQLSLPVAKVNSMPVALSLMGASGSDETLLEIAATCCGIAVDGLAPLKD